MGINIRGHSATTKRRTFAYKKASMHGKKGRTSGGKKEMMQRWITKNRTYEGKKEGAGHSIPVFWDPVVPAFDRQLSYLL